MERGCGIDQNKFEQTDLDKMLNMSMFTDDLTNRRGMYNEVLIDWRNLTASLPFSIAAFVFGLDGLNTAEFGGEAVATERYIRFLDKYCLTEEDIPLLEANLSKTGGRVFRDVSADARKFLESHPPSRMQADRLERQSLSPSPAATPSPVLEGSFREGVPSSVREFVPTGELKDGLEAYGLEAMYDEPAWRDII